MILQQEESELIAKLQDLAGDLTAATEERELLSGRLEFLTYQEKGLKLPAKINPRARTELKDTRDEIADLTSKLAAQEAAIVDIQAQQGSANAGLQAIGINRVKDDYRLAELALCQAHRDLIKLQLQIEDAKNQVAQKAEALEGQVSRMRGAGLSCDGFHGMPISDLERLEWLESRIKLLS